MNDEQQLEWLSEPRKDGSIGGADDPSYGWVNVYDWQAQFTWQLAQIKALTEKLDKTVAALEGIADLAAPLSRLTGGDDEAWECAVRQVRAAIAAAKGAPMT